MPRRDTKTPLLGALGSRVQNLRLERGFTILELSERSNVPKGSISTIEAGRGNVTLETCAKLATGLGVGLADLLEEADMVVRLRPCQRKWKVGDVGAGAVGCEG